jgi:plasmid replication initiation protein
VKVTGNEKHGIATIFDNDVLIFVIAQYMNAINHGMKTGRRFQFTGYEYRAFTGKKYHGGQAYKDLWASLQRLHNTFVETNIRLGGTTTTTSFNWLSEIKQIKDGAIHRGYELVLPEWVYESITNKKLVLTLDDDYFSIRGGLQRWLYLFARKTSGWQAGGWSESIESIYRKSASTGTLSEFKRKVKKIATDDSLLGYSVEVVGDGSNHTGKGLYFLRRNELIEMLAAEKPKTSRRGAIQWRGIKEKE